jgi:hypothetical protein
MGDDGGVRVRRGASRYRSPLEDGAGQRPALPATEGYGRGGGNVGAPRGDAA